MNDEKLCTWWSSTEDGYLVWHAVDHNLRECQELAALIMADPAVEYCPYCGGALGEADENEVIPPRWQYLEDNGRWSE